MSSRDRTQYGSIVKRSNRVGVLSLRHDTPPGARQDLARIVQQQHVIKLSGVKNVRAAVQALWAQVMGAARYALSYSQPRRTSHFSISAEKNTIKDMAGQKRNSSNPSGSVLKTGLSH